jgi:SAM-dependent methyltransferase
MTWCDIESKNSAVVKVDLEKPLPFVDGEFDTVLLMHVLEHIYDTRRLLAEMQRISRGNILIAVPFLIPYHPDPGDYFRFTHLALERLLRDAGFNSVHITPWGHGLFTASLYLSERFVQIRFVVALFYCLARGLDWLALKIFRKRLSYQGALGYLCVASKD